jgi:hypothetical protein
MLVSSVAMLLGCAVTSAQGQLGTTIQAIRTAPTLDTYLRLRSAFHGDRDSCREVGATTSEVSEALVGMIEDGDAIAMRTGLLVFRCWDGGLLTDFFRATGQYFDREPRGLVGLLDDYLMSRTDVRSLVTTLPERAVDDLDEQIRILRGRRASLMSDSSFSWLANELENEALRREALKAEAR